MVLDYEISKICQLKKWKFFKLLKVNLLFFENFLSVKISNVFIRDGMKENYIQDEHYMKILREFILNVYDAFKMI